MDKRDIICLNVGKYRRIRNMSQTELGNLIGKSLGWVNKLEKCNKASVLTDDLVTHIAYVLGIPVAYLYDEEEHEVTNAQNVIINTIRVDSDPNSWSMTLNDLNELTQDQFENLTFAIDLYRQAQERLRNGNKKE